MQFRTVLICAFLIGSGCSSQDNDPVAFVVSAESPGALEHAGVIVDWDAIQSHFDNGHFVILNAAMDGRDIPSQLDDLDGDGQIDVLFFIVDKTMGPELEVIVTPTLEQATYPNRTQAVVAVRQGGHFNEEGLYVDGSDYVSVTSVRVPVEQEQDSDWAMFEGPVWESDLVGYRYYLDDRFRTDVFGKRVPDLVLGKREGDYHEISEWGADILHVGGSLGLGSPAVVTDSGVAAIDNADERMVEVVASGPLRSILRTTMNGWDVLDTSVDVVSELEIRAGERWTEQRLTFDGLPADAKVATGIVRHDGAPTLSSGETAGILYMYTWGPQTDQGDGMGMGMAVLVPNNQNPELVDTDTETHLVTFDAPGGKAAYRYLAAWELEANPFPDQAAFEAAIQEEARRWAAAIEVTWK